MAKKAKLLELDVSFGDVSIGENTGRLGVTMQRKGLTPAQADKHLCGKRLTGRVISDAGNSNGDQPAMFEAGESIDAVFDVKAISLKPKSISCGLTFMLQSVDINALAHFAQRSGKLQIDQLEDLLESKPGRPKKDGDGEDEDEDEE